MVLLHRFMVRGDIYNDNMLCCNIPGSYIRPPSSCKLSCIYCVYGIPDESKHILKYDPINGIASFVGKEAHKGFK